MQVNEFIQYVNGEAAIVDASEQDVLSLIEEFPYCQTSRLLYAINLNANSSILFEEQLKKTAAYCSDREKLFEHIYSIGQIVEKKEQVEVEVEKENEEKPIDDSQKTMIEEKPIQQDDELKILEREYLTQAVSTSILLDAEEEAKQLVEEDSRNAEEEKELFDTSVEHSFSDWLKHFGEGTETTQSIKPKKERDIDLINKFIQEDPRIEPKKTEFFSPSNLAKKSVEDDGFVSETLAIIHVDQGNFEEAIRVYEKLSLNNPKKRSYFAAQIKNLKQKIEP